ncbi:hypothetical protein GCM10009736_38400 [Actinomadura bangladeshensis]
MAAVRRQRPRESAALIAFGRQMRRLREAKEYFPRGTTITNDPDYLQAVADELNNRPRAIFGFKKPKEVFAELLTSGIASTG